jgi:hypothetical protein
MNLFLPACYVIEDDITSWYTGQATTDNWFSYKPKSGYTGGFLTDGQWHEEFKPTFPYAPPPFTLPRSPYIEVPVSFGVTTYRSYPPYGYAKAPQYKNDLKIATEDGVIRLWVYGNKVYSKVLLAHGESSFRQNALGTTVVLTDLGLDYIEYPEGYSIYWQYAGSTSTLFGPGIYDQFSELVTLVGAGEALISKDIYSNGYVVFFGPRAKAYSEATLTDTTQIALRAEAAASSTVFCALEVSSFLNFRASGTAAASAVVNMLSGSVMEAEIFGVATASCNASLTPAMRVAAQATASIRAIMKVGVPIFLKANAKAAATVFVRNSLSVSSRVSGMRLYINLDTREFVASPVRVTPVTAMYFTRRDIEAIDLKFVRGGVTVPISYGSQGKIGIKSSYSGAALALDTAWTEKNATTGPTLIITDVTYQFTLNLYTQQIESLFVTDDEEFVEAMIEVEWTDGGSVNTTLPCAAIIQNDILRGNETAPTVLT